MKLSLDGRYYYPHAAGKEGEAQTGPSHRTSTSSRAGTLSNSVSYQFCSPPSDPRQLPGDSRVEHSLWDVISFPAETVFSLWPTGLPQTPLHQLPNCTCHLPSQHLLSNSHHPVLHPSRKPGKRSGFLSVSLSANNHQSLSPVDSAPKYSSIPLLSFQVTQPWFLFSPPFTWILKQPSTGTGFPPLVFSPNASPKNSF